MARRPLESKVWFVHAERASDAFAQALAKKALLNAWNSPASTSVALVPTRKLPRAASRVPVPDDAGKLCLVEGVGALSAAARLIIPLRCCVAGIPRAVAVDVKSALT